MRSLLVVAVLAIAFALHVDASPIPGRGFNWTTYVNLLAGPTMAMDTVGDLYVVSGFNTYKFPRSQWDGVHPIVTNSSLHLLTTNNGGVSFGAMVSNSKGRIYHNQGCELNKTTGVFRCGIWSNTGLGCSVDPANDDIIISDYNRLRRVPNPDNHTAPITPLHIWTQVPSISTTIDGVYMDRQGRIFGADLSGRVIIVNGTSGALIQQVPTGSLAAGVPDGIAVSGDGKTAVLGMTGNRMASLNMTDYSLQLFSDGVGEGYHDFSIVGSDGCIYQSDYTNKILRITREDGTCDFVSAVSPPVESGCGTDCETLTASATCDSVSVASDTKCATMQFSSTVSTCN